MIDPSKPLFGIFVGTRWGMTHDRDLAIRTAERHASEGAEVMEIKHPEPDGYDSPTFRVLADRIWPSPAPAVLPKAIGY